MKEFYEGLDGKEIRERQEFAYEAAVQLKRRFMSPDVGAVLDAVMSGWPAAAEEPERRGLLEVEPAFVRFRHELVRMAVEAAIAPHRKLELHARLLAELERRVAALENSVKE